MADHVDIKSTLLSNDHFADIVFRSGLYNVVDTTPPDIQCFVSSYFPFQIDYMGGVSRVRFQLRICELYGLH